LELFRCRNRMSRVPRPQRHGNEPTGIPNTSSTHMSTFSTPEATTKPPGTYRRGRARPVPKRSIVGDDPIITILQCYRLVYNRRVSYFHIHQKPPRTPTQENALAVVRELRSGSTPAGGVDGGFAFGHGGSSWRCTPRPWPSRSRLCRRSGTCR
jgi:hypothetical protein